ncbi:nitrogen regulation protein NR(II) [Alkalimarinus alittae]|uniref:Sensory histidine kinase/phosphatase NtrB n=1 Tax=Alkalimarinus alittae TaxID=2961619 RepID=A0ABY6N117_9ALTE|nr:nitrogen regulation protein NR(II) [Alkalimarinus alittae]UZE95774.1 nitrogen regulation protein NR(II) [Alkalimarinus alittae]
MLTSNFHKSLLENLSTAVILLDQQLKAVYINPSAEVLLEVSGKRTSGSYVRDLFTETPDSSETLKHSLAAGHSYTKRETEFLLHNGNKITVDYSASPVNGVFPPVVLIEIQPRDRLIRISREEELLSNQEATRILIRGMAHEIKNPLGGIRGSAQLLERELKDPSLHEYTQIIIEESDRLRNLVDRMLGPNKVSKLEPTNIHEVLERVYNLINVEAKGQVRLIRDYDPSIPEFQGDKEQLIQAFLNIARNAMQALTQQTGRQSLGNIVFKTRPLRQFTIGHTRHRLVLRVDIIDDGPGVPESLVQNIFYPMVSGRAEGTGLGLSITQGIIGQHHGLVECESEPGKTNFIIFIPLENKLELKR